MTDLYHQLGHRFQWSLDSIRDDAAADGVIVAARYISKDETITLPASLRSTSIFDPQFFVPGVQRGKLPTYEFFPDVVANPFDTSGYDDNSKRTSAELCVRFQIENGFRYCVIPCRFRPGSPRDFVQNEQDMFLAPFVEAYEMAADKRPLLLQLVLTDEMLLDEEVVNEVLNWVTGIREINGIYLIVHIAKRPKQIDDPELVLSLLRFVTSIRLNGLQVIIGYQNTEALVMLVADPTGVATGGYENLRRFHPKVFEKDDEKKQAGPNPRIYVPTLMQWIDSRYLKRIMSSVQDAQTFLGVTNYQDLMFDKTYRWHFTKPEPYKHYFVVFARQFRYFASLPLQTRFHAVLNACEVAMSEFARLRNTAGVVFPPDSNGDHLAAWITALNIYGMEQEY